MKKTKNHLEIRYYGTGHLTWTAARQSCQSERSQTILTKESFQQLKKSIRKTENNNRFWSTILP
jgi:hypothetical protein